MKTKSSFSVVGESRRLRVKTWAAILSVTAVLLTALSDTETFQDDTTRAIDFPNAIKRINTLWETRKIEKIELVHIPASIVFRKNVSSSSLDANYLFKLVVKEAEDTQIGSEIVAKLRALTTQPLGRAADLRWGFIFYSSENTRLFALYFDSSGLEGVVEGACVKFNSDILKTWAESKFGSILK